MDSEHHRQPVIGYRNAVGEAAIKSAEFITASTDQPFVAEPAARRTGASRKQQTRVVRAIKRARFLALVPYTIDDTR